MSIWPITKINIDEEGRYEGFHLENECWGILNSNYIVHLDTTSSFDCLVLVWDDSKDNVKAGVLTKEESSCFSRGCLCELWWQVSGNDSEWNWRKLVSCSVRTGNS